MTFLKRLPIKRKVGLVILLTCALALGLAMGVLFAFQLYSFRQNFTRDLSVLAEIIANNSTAALTLKDQRSAEQILRALKARPHILSATIKLPDRTTFARCGATESDDVFQAMPADGFRFDGEYLLHGKPIILDHQMIGTLYLRTDYQKAFLELVKVDAGICVAVLASSLLLAYLLSRWLQHFITDPILKLAATAKLIAENRDYSLRVEKSEEDELGFFMDEFNHMLGQIQAQDSDLQQARRQLAHRVEELKERGQLDAFGAFVGLQLTRDQSLDSMLQQCSEAMVEHLGTALARVWTLNEDGKALQLRASAGLHTHLKRGDESITAGMYEIGRIVETRRPLLINSVIGDGRIQNQELAMQEDLLSFVGFPLLVGDQLVGVMAMFGRQPVSESTYQTLGSVANAVALGIERKRTEAALKENEERFRSLFENATIGLYRMDPAGTIQVANSTLLRMLGCETLAELTIKSLRTDGCLDPSQREIFLGRIKNEGAIHGLEAIWERRDGAQVFVRESAKAIRDESGAVEYYEGTVEDITERRKAELQLEHINKELIEASRHAGMAEVATGVLHNVGNVLNSLNVSATLMREYLKRSEIVSVGKVARLLEQHSSDLGAFLTTDPKGKFLPNFLNQLSEHLTAEHAALLHEQDQLLKNIDHIKQIVAMQQDYARVSGFMELVSVADLVDDALQLNSTALSRHGVQVVRDYSPVPSVTVDKHRVLQILVNLLQNAKYAMDDAGRPDKQLTVGISMNGNQKVKISVQDNGVGIPPENLTRIFAHGFTTRKGGHGFGLNSGASAAKEMGCALKAFSAGPGKGARFTLELPISSEVEPQTFRS